MVRPLLFFLCLGCFSLSLVFSCSERADNRSVSDDAGQSGQTEGDSGSEAGFYEDYEGTNRVIWQKPEIVISLLGDMEGKTVADIGAGTGHFSKRLARKAGKVIAIDIDPRYVDYLDSIRRFELDSAYRERLETRLAEPDDPNLGKEEVDAALIVNTFMYMADRKAYLETLYPALKPGGRILIIDFKNIPTPIGPPVEIRLPLETVRQELVATGFRIVKADTDMLQYQYVVLAEKE